MLLGLTPTTLRKWRCRDRQAGLGDGIPGRGGLLWRSFGRSIRYAVSSVAPEAADARR